MLPTAEFSLTSLAGYMGKEMVPRIDDAYTANMTALISGLLLMIAHEHEHAANNLLQENMAIRELLHSAKATLDETVLPACLDVNQAADFTLSAMREENHALRNALIALHAGVEEQGTPEARTIDAAIWTLLAAVRERESIEHVLDLFNSPG